MKEYMYLGKEKKGIFHKASPPPPLDGINFHPFFIPLFSVVIERILHFVSVKNITFKPSYNWFKIDIHQQLQPLTANYLAMFKVISTTTPCSAGFF